MNWNVNGLSRLPIHDVFEYLTSFTIIGLCETWSYKKGEFANLLSGYKCYDAVKEKKSTTGRVSGGIAVFVKSGFTAGVKRLYEQYKNAVFLLLDKSVFHLKHNILLASVYVPPENSPSYDGLNESDGVMCLNDTLQALMAENDDLT